MVTGLAVLAGSGLIVVALLSGYAADTQLAIYLVALALAPAAIGQLCESVFVACERAEDVTYSIATESFLRTGLSLLVLLMGYGLVALYVVLVVTRVLMLVFYLWLIHSKISELRWRFAWPFLRQLFLDWRVFAVENWLQNVQASLGTILYGDAFHLCRPDYHPALHRYVCRLNSAVAHSGLDAPLGFCQPVPELCAFCQKRPASITASGFCQARVLGDRLSCVYSALGGRGCGLGWADIGVAELSFVFPVCHAGQ
jgi:hypothetical protein